MYHEKRARRPLYSADYFIISNLLKTGKPSVRTLCGCNLCFCFPVSVPCAAISLRLFSFLNFVHFYFRITGRSSYYIRENLITKENRRSSTEKQASFHAVLSERKGEKR
jgi:hypothetical protein